jgi:hypothetical protein
VNYMWEWPLNIGQGDFEAWEAQQPELVEMGLGYEMPADVSAVLQTQRVDQVEFRSLVEAIVEIIYYSFYAAADNEVSLNYLSQVFLICRQRGVQPPPLEVFAQSRFNDGHGWGAPLSMEQRDCWRRAGSA